MVIHIVGARPQFIKLAPVVEAFKANSIPFKVIHTGQHYDAALSGNQFAALGLPEADYNLGIGSASQAEQTAKMMIAIEDVLIKEKLSLVVVYGDTNSTLAGAITAAKLNIPVAHVEAGVRSFDRRMPEEINRIIADRVSSWHFCPTQNAVNLLEKEGVKGIFTGDVMLDALLKFSSMDISLPYQKPFICATIHRAENTNDRKKFIAIWEAFSELSKKMKVLLPVHPRTRNMYPELVNNPLENVIVIDPVDYLTMITMIKNAELMITDSGGIQKEAFLLKTPCVTVRDTTEWPETIAAGKNILAETDVTDICTKAEKMLGIEFGDIQNPFGDGRAATHIAEFINQHI